MKTVDVIWQKPVSTYAISACEALVASVNSVNTSGIPASAGEIFLQVVHPV